MKVYIDSGTHVTGEVEQRIRNVENALESPEIVFYEGDSSNFSFDAIRNNILTLIIAPLLGIAVLLQIYVFTEMYGRLKKLMGSESGGRDQDIVDKLKKKYDIESIEVDTGLFWLLRENWLLISAINYVIIALIFLFIKKSLIILFTIGIGGLFIGYIMLFILLGLAHETRNRHFTKVITEKSDRFQNGCLVTGEAHHAAVGELLENNTRIDVINPVPENTSIRTRVALSVLKTVQYLDSLW